ncbi:MAG: aspartate aminotransferase family protein [Armatimonadota bacterium]
MTNDEAAQLTEQYLMPTYSPLPVAFVRGEGARLWDADGNEYLDFVAGISVLAPGHSHPKVTGAICEQAQKIMHTSNLYNIAPQGLLAKKLSEISCGDRSFFCNSGAEANEAAIKLARKWADIHRGPDCRTIITAYMSFHGRTMATVTATGQEKYQKPFAPLPGGFKYAPFDNIEALENIIDDTTCAIMLEPIQAEGGINVPSSGYLQAVGDLCEANELLLIFDEVQTGMGRTGEWFAYMDEGVEPDIFTMAKALGGGFPIGACVAKEDVAQAFEPGNHASTFGGNHLACTAALAAIEAIESEDMVANAARMGQYFKSRVDELAAEHDFISGCRGRGLLLGLELKNINGRDLQVACLEKGLVVNALGEDLLRIAPPLTITEADVDEAFEKIITAAQSM